MALWNFKSKDKYEDVDSVVIPTQNSENAAVAVVVTTVSHPKSVVAAGAVVSGSMSAPGDIQVEGHVIGDVRCATATIGKDGDVKGNVTAETATIRGRVVGNVRARIIQLAATGSVEGDLSHAVLIIEEGGVFEGRSKRSADPLSELALAAPEESETVTKTSAASTPKSKAKTPKAAKASAVTAPTTDTASEPFKIVEPGANLDDEPRSGVADALGERFAVAS
jgi:cytoskeletal protein CcmA (bactofilin family)